ncbi:hypothetical protein SLA2020_327130 [Shorea laevis]
MATKPHHDADTNDIVYPKDGNGLYIFGPRAFNIAFGNDPRYWKLPKRESDGPAELVKVSWLQVTGLAAVERGKKYEITFKLSMKANNRGWRNSPVYLMAKIGRRGEYQRKRLQLDHSQMKEPTYVPNFSGETFQIFVPATILDGRLFFGLYEVWSGNWKEGPRIHGAIVKEIE